MSRVVLHIDRLVLHGVGRGDAAAFADGLRSELSARLAGVGAVDSLVRLQGDAAMHAGRVRVPAGTDAATVGRAVAAHIVAPGAPR